MHNLETRSQTKIHGFVLIKCFPGYEKDINLELKKLGKKTHVTSVNLAYDFVVKDLSNSQKEFKESILKIRKIPHVMSTTILFTDHILGFQNSNDEVRKVVKVKTKKFFILGITLALFTALVLVPDNAFAQTYHVFDREPPIIMIPKDIYVTSEVPSQIFFSVKALDKVDGEVPVSCDKISMGTTFKMGKTTVRCEAYDKAGNRNQASFVVTLGYEVVQIPSWVKNITILWVNNSIDDDTYAGTIGYLVHNKIVKVPTTRISDFYETEIPIWIKINAQHWVNEEISDDEYSIMLQWLINRGFVKI